MTAQQELVKHLNQIRVLSNNPVVERALDDIETLAGAFMRPAVDFLPDIHFTTAERRMLDLLHFRLGKTVTSHSLLDAAASGGGDPSSRNVLTVVMHRIRDKFRQFSVPYHIATDWSHGYRLCEGAETVPLSDRKSVSRKYIMASRAA